MKSIVKIVALSRTQYSIVVFHLNLFVTPHLGLWVLNPRILEYNWLGYIYLHACTDLNCVKIAKQGITYTRKVYENFDYIMDVPALQIHHKSGYTFRGSSLGVGGIPGCSPLPWVSGGFPPRNFEKKGKVLLKWPSMVLDLVGLMHIYLGKCH